MPTGDSLTVFVALAGIAVAFMIGALTASSGWRVWLLWGCFGAFTLATLGWVFPPNQSPLLMGVLAVLVALARSGALIMIGTVGIVSLMIGGRKPSAKGTDIATIVSLPAKPDFAPAKPAETKWVPDTLLINVMLYLFDESQWGEYANREFVDVEVKLLIALRESQLLAWGKSHPDDKLAFQIRSDFWIDVAITPQSNAVFSKTRNVNAYDVKLSLAQIELAWPRKPAAQA